MIDRGAKMTRRELLMALPATAIVTQTMSEQALGAGRGSDILAMTAVDLAAAIRTS